MSEASELRKDRAKYLRRCRERGIERIAKMTPEEWAAFEKRLDEVKKIDPKKLFFDVHDK